jgi:ParB-like chromosome segregation protein Spo0J
MGERGSMTTDFPIYEQAALGELHEELGRLRLCEAAALTAMERSLMTLGQITPLVVHASAHGYEVLDGFKRLRAARSLNWTCLWVQVMKVGAVQAKLHLCQSNRAGGLTEIEEAWVVRALYREDGLTQPEIGRLMARTKSWVNRRLLLAEALGDELQVDLRIGLISATTARELCRLPRGNQQEVATTVKQRGLTTRQAQTLVEAWLAAPTESARESLLTTVRGTQEGKEARRPRTGGEWMLHDAEELRRRCGRLHGRLVAQPPTRGDADVLTGLRTLRPALSGLLEALSQTLPKGQVA